MRGKRQRETEKEQQALADEEDTASTTFLEMTERRGGGPPGADGGSADEAEASPRDPLRRPGTRGAGLYTEPVKDVPPATATDYSKDWKRVAEIVDRLFFWLFLLAITLSTLVLLHPLMSLLTEDEKQTGKEGQHISGT